MRLMLPPDATYDEPNQCVSIRQHTSAYRRMPPIMNQINTSAYVSIRQHTAAFVSRVPPIMNQNNQFDQLI
jgi:hypothetical protein